ATQGCTWCYPGGASVPSLSATARGLLFFPFPPLNPPLPAWPDARVWVIGASTGIGAATAKMLLDAGGRVALSARSVGKLRDVAGDRANAVVEPLDFTKSADVIAAWDRIRSQWGGVDLVLVVAGTHKEMRAWELNEKDSRALLEVNLHAVLNQNAAVAPRLL